jgi:hypothetical protein
MSEQACGMPGCEEVLPVSPYWSHEQVAEQVRKRGWFVWHDRLVCPAHLQEASDPQHTSGPNDPVHETHEG